MATASAAPVHAAHRLTDDDAGRRAARLLGWALLGLGLALLAMVGIALRMPGGHFVVVSSGSMEPAIGRGSLAFFRRIPAEGVYRGDIVLFAGPDGRQVTHRVASVTADRAMVVTRGDATDAADANPVPVGALRGKYVFSLPYFGYAAQWAGQPVGFLGVVLAPGIIVITLATVSIFRARRLETGSVHHGERIVRAPGPAGEGDHVRNPLKRHDNRLAPEPDPVTPPETRAEQPAPSPELPSTPEPPAAVPALDPALKAGAFARIPLRSQATATDARTERLVRSIRGEVEELRETLDAIASDRGEFLEADIAAVIADPEGAASLPPAVLVRAIVAANERNEQMLAELGRQARRNAKLKSKLRALRITHAQVAGRMATLDEVIGALHANLEDLRLERGGEVRRVAQPQQPQPLRAAASDPLPPPRPQLFDRD
ncbi:MAG: signal peptidase I [Dehalococcoidia bacterium]|nr:signal peptidase I [Dehalococcoidia bacterium]